MVVNFSHNFFAACCSFEFPALLRCVVGRSNQNILRYIHDIVRYLQQAAVTSVEPTAVAGLVKGGAILVVSQCASLVKSNIISQNLRGKYL